MFSTCFVPIHICFSRPQDDSAAAEVPEPCRTTTGATALGNQQRGREGNQGKIRNCDVKRETGWDFFWIYIRSIYIYIGIIYDIVYIYRYSLIKSFFFAAIENLSSNSEKLSTFHRSYVYDEDQLTYAWALTRSWFNVDVQRGCSTWMWFD